MVTEEEIKEEKKKRKIKKNAEIWRMAIDIQVESLNIIHGRGKRLIMACKEVWDVGMNLVLLTETKLNECHTHHAYRFDIYATKC